MFMGSNTVSSCGAALIRPIWYPSPNFGVRRDGLEPLFIVIHYTAMRSVEAALERLCDPTAKVSAHYVISRVGGVWQLVSEESRAWHAGSGSWCGWEDVNSVSIGIELDNDGQSPFCEPQIVVLETLLKDILDRWNLPPQAVIGHSDVAPGRKWDPGGRFDWDRLARQGLSAAPSCSQEAPNDIDLQVLLQRAGYTAVARHEVLLKAFRLRHRMHIEGPADKVDRMILYALGQDLDCV